MEAWKQDINNATTLRPRLEEILRMRGNEFGTETLPLATACFHWLEERQYFVDILTLGVMQKALLEEYLEVSNILFIKTIFMIL